MKAFFSKYWPSFLHAIAISILYSDVAVKAELAAHPKTSTAIALGWGLLLHWAQSPKDAPLPPTK